MLLPPMLAQPLMTNYVTNASTVDDHGDVERRIATPVARLRLAIASAKPIAQCTACMTDSHATCGLSGYSSGARIGWKEGE
jgi:hypothetical protein